jgi:hypothetical protein
MARRRSAAEQIGVPELDEQEEQQRAAAEEAARAEAEAAQPPPEAPDEPEVPDWVPERFRKDPTQLAKSYAELETELRRRGERDAARDREIAELREQMQQTRQPPEDWDDRIEAAYEEDPIGTIRWLVEQRANAVVGQALGHQARASEPAEQIQDQLFAKTMDDVMTAEYEDWDEVKPEIAQMLAEDPSLVPESAFGSIQGVKRHLSTLYRSVKYDALLAEKNDLGGRGAKQADIDRVRKQEAQTLTGATGRAPEPTEAEKELAEMRGALANTSYGLHRAQEKRVS